MNKLPNYPSATPAVLLGLVLGLLFFVSCKPYTGYSKKYIISKSDNNNWTTSGIIECDSFTMVNKNKATLWIDGQKMNLEGGMINVFSNRSYVAPK